MADTLVRGERPDDIEAIAEVTRCAFFSHEYSSHTEQFIIAALRRAGALSVSLVAERAGAVMGHIAFSPVAITDGSTGWYGLGPLSVMPERQGQGVGRALVQGGLAVLRERGAKGCVVLGDPSFYSRFGFANNPDLVLDGVPQSFFLALNFGPKRASGKVDYHASFDAGS